MKKMFFGALALALFTFTSCRNEETTEVTEETAKETAINTEVQSEMTPEVEDSMEVETEEAVDSLKTTGEMEQETTPKQ